MLLSFVVSLYLLGRGTGQNSALEGLSLTYLVTLNAVSAAKTSLGNLLLVTLDTKRIAAISCYLSCLGYYFTNDMKHCF